MQSMSAFVYGCCGFFNTSEQSPRSTISPLNITITRLHNCDIIPKLWVISKIDMPLLSLTRQSSSIICF